MINNFNLSPIKKSVYDDEPTPNWKEFFLFKWITIYCSKAVNFIYLVFSSLDLLRNICISFFLFMKSQNDDKKIIISILKLIYINRKKISKSQNENKLEFNSQAIFIVCQNSDFYENSNLHINHEIYHFKQLPQSLDLIFSTFLKIVLFKPTLSSHVRLCKEYNLFKNHHYKRLALIKML